MKILNVAPEANKSGHYGFHNIRDTFLRLGCEIIDFDFIDEEKRLGKHGMNQWLKQLVDTERPDLFYHAIVADELDKAVLDYIANETETTSLVLFSDDDWRLVHSLERVGHYNFALTTVREALQEYTGRGYHNVIFSPWGGNPHVYRPLDLEKKYDVTFVGQSYTGRPELIKFLRANGVNVRVWGTGWEQCPELRDIAGGFLPMYKVVKLFSQSKIVLGMAWTSQGMLPQIKGRTFEYAASRAFQLTNYDERLKEYFEEGKEIVFYRGADDLLGKIKYYLAHDKEREEIARNAHERALRDHTWEQRFRHIFRVMAERRPAGKKSISIPTHDKPTLAAPGTVTHVEESTTPLVSVVTYIHNMAEFVDDLVPSVLNQTYRNFEYIILDDGSTDNVKERISKYLHDKRLRYVYQESMGQGGRFIHLLINKCLSLTRGELFCGIGGDDVFLPNRLERHVAEFLKDPDLDIAFSEGEIIDGKGEVVTPGGFGIAAHAFNRWNLARLVIKQNIIPHPTVMMRRSCFDKVGLFEDGFAADYQFWLKSAAHLKFKFVNEKLIKYRVHEKGTSTCRANRDYVAAETVRLKTSARQRYSILDLYPEIEYCQDKQQALVSAYLDFGLCLMTGSFPSPALAGAEFKKALDHNPNQIEAINNLGVCLMGMGQHAEGLAWLEKAQASQRPDVQRNLQLAREIMTSGKQTEALNLLVQNPSVTELFSIDPENNGGKSRQKTGGAGARPPQPANKRRKLLYLGMRYDYGDPYRGLSFEEKNFHDTLARYPGVDLTHFDFMALAQKHGVQTMSQMLVETVKKEKPDLLFGIFYNETADPTREAMDFITRHTSTTTCLWMCDDHWRFDNYSRHWAPHVSYLATTASSALPKYEALGFKHKVIKSQWACNTSLYHPYETAQDKAVTFIGQPHSNRKPIIEFIKRRGVDISVYGWGWDERSRIPFHEMVRMFSRSKINLNLSNSSANAAQQIKGRNFEVPGCRAFLLSGPADNLDAYYDVGKEVEAYNDLEEMVSKIKFYLDHESERQRIAERGYRRTIECHTWHHRFKEIFERIGL